MEAMDYQHNSKDRPLGRFTIDIKQLASAGSDPTTQPFVSTGPVERTEKLILDHGRSMKGSIVYKAEFFPCTPLKGVTFDKVVSPLSQAQLKDAEDMDDGASFIEPEHVDETMDLEDDLAAQMSAEATSAVQGAEHTSSAGADGPLNGDKAATETEGFALSKEQVLQSQSGVLVFNIVSGNLAKKGARLEVALDDAYWPAYTSEVATTIHQTWDEVGESFIRELAYSRIILRLNHADKDSREDIQAEFRTSLVEFLEQCLVRVRSHLLTIDTESFACCLTGQTCRFHAHE